MTGTPSERGNLDGHRPASAPQESTTYNHLHGILGLQRSDLWKVIDAYKQGDTVDEFSMKERVGALEGMVFDDLWNTRILPRFADPTRYGVHGLAAVTGLENLVELTGFQSSQQRVAASSEVAAYPMSADEWHAVVNFYQQQANGEERFDLLYQISMAQANTMLYEMHCWETEKKRSIAAGERSAETSHYQEFIALLSTFKPHISPAGIDYPAYRKVIKGLLFGTPFQWRIIQRFPEFAATVDMEWNEQTFDALMRALQMVVKKVARTHASILTLQGHFLETEGYDLSDMIICRRVGENLQFMIDPVMMRSLKDAFAVPEVADAARRLDSGPVTSCTALYSDMFDGTIQWNSRIAKDLMIPSENSQ